MMNVLDRNQTVTDSKDMLAKLLASENITVVRSGVPTASFDTVNRVLRLPQWQNLTPEVEEMLIGHEVGHALYTTNDYIEECSSDKALMGYMNVIEDVRIERKVKSKYPGLRKTFTAAYRKLQEDDFFEVKTRDLSKLLFIDRINLYFKAGFTCGVKFSTAEAEIVKRVAACDSIHDVYNLAAELLEFTRDELDREQNEVEKMLAENRTDEDAQDEDESYFDQAEDGEDDYEESYNAGESEEIELSPEEDEGSEGDETSTGFGSNAGSSDWEAAEEDQQDQAESVTERALRKNLSEIADTDREYINIEFGGKKDFCYNPIISSKEILSLVPDVTVDDEPNWNEFYNSVTRDINYLVKEFEMRKQATRYSRATRAKTGDLAVNKLFAYKLTDDLFKRITVLPDGKNHGFIMLLDWSGSMHEYMQDTIKQTLTIAMFLRRIQVPFKVYAFTDQYGRGDMASVDEINRIRAFESARRNSTTPSFAFNKFHLLDFLNDRQSQSEFNAMAKLLLSNPWRHYRYLSLGGTPLYEAMWFVADHVGEFIKQNSVEKFSFITLTDGDGHPLYPNFQTRKRVQVPTGVEGITRPRLIENSVSMTDPKTRKTYKMTVDRYSDSNTKVMLSQILRDRYNARIIGFHICRNTAREIGYFFNGNCTEEPYSNRRNKLFADVRTEMRRNGFFSGDQFGDDKTFILRSDKMGLETKEITIDSTKNAGAIARQFSKQLGANRSNKVMLNQFMELVA